MAKENILEKIVEQRRLDIKSRGLSFGFEIPAKRVRPVNEFMAKKGLILEIKRASPSRGDIAPNLCAGKTAEQYALAGACAISCLTEENYFKGSLKDLMEVCKTVEKVPVLRKDFLLEEDEVDISFLCGADAVLLISGILTLEKMILMAERCCSFGIKAFVEVRSKDDAQKFLAVQERFPNTVVAGVNSRNLKDFSIDFLYPAMLKKMLGGKVVFESGVTTMQACKKVRSMGFDGILLGEGAAKNPQMAGEFVRAFESANENLYGKNMLALAEKIDSYSKGGKGSCDDEGGSTGPMIKVCGLTRTSDLVLADELGADFVGFIFADGFERNVYGKRFDEIKKCLSDIKAFKVGVVVDLESKEARAAFEYVESGVLDFVQLHGLDCKTLPDYVQRLPHYFAVTQNKTCSAEELLRLGEARFLQDLKSHDYEGGNAWIAGGINAQNVASLIEQFTPELVDVSSGIEDEGLVGVKNVDKMKAFFKNARGLSSLR